jgi:cell division protein FtsI (penicillin-binding protein 3)
MLAIMVMAFVGIVLRLTTLQVRDNGELAQMGLDQRVRTIQLPAARGQILDRDGTPLAVSREARDVYVNPQLVTDAPGEAAVVAESLDLQPGDVREAFEADGTFVYLARQVDLGVAEELEAKRLPGVGFLSVPQRYYPAGSLAPQVLGFVNVDGVGIAGLEDEYQKQLAGTPGEQTAELSADGLPISTATDTITAPVAGTSEPWGAPSS